MEDRDRFIRGEAIDLSQAEDRTISAAFLESLIEGPDRTYPAALRLTGAIIEGKLNFRFATVKHEVILKNCELAGELNCRGTRFEKSVHFEGCRFRQSVYFDRAHVTGTLLFSDSTFGETLSLADATVDENIIGMRATFADFNATRLRVGKSVVFSGATFTGKARLIDAQVGATAEFEGVRLKEVNASRMHVAGAAFFRADKTMPTTFDEAAIFLEASFGLTDFSGAEFRKEAEFRRCSFGMAATFASVPKGGKLFRTTFGGDARFQFSKADGWLIFAGALFRGQALFDACRCGGADFRAIAFDSSIVSTSFLSRGNFIGCSVDGPLLFNGAMFESTATFSSAKVTLNAEFGDYEGVPTRFRDKCRFVDAHLGTSVQFERAEFLGGVDLGNTRIEHGLFMREAIFGQKATLVNATIGGSLDAVATRFEQDAVFDGVVVGGSMMLRGVRADHIRMVHARVTGNIELHNASVHKVNLWGAVVQREVQLAGVQIVTLLLDAARVEVMVDLSRSSVWSVDFAGANFGALQLDADVNHLPVRVDVRRFAYGSFSGDGHALLARSEPFDRDAYLRVENLHRTRGEDGEAHDIYYAMRDRATRLMLTNGERLRWFFNQLQDGLFGYGARPARLLLWTLLFLVLGTYVFSQPGALVHKDAKALRPQFVDSIIVSTKLFVPTPDLAPSEPFIPGNAALYAVFHRLCGAIIVPVGVLLLTGFFIRR